LHIIHQQLGVPVEKSRDVAQQLLGVELICALGGEYQLFDAPDDLRYWGSTHWPTLLTDRPQGSGQFASPILAWFRGLDAEIKLLDDRVLADATLEVQSPASGRAQLPFFNLWRRN
jgi:hypothetical protein